MFDDAARRNLLLDGVLSRLMDALTGGVFLAALALDAGASNLQLGLLAALPFAAHAVQWPVALGLLRRGGGRKRLTLVGAFASRVLLATLAAAALALPAGLPAGLLVAGLALSSALAMSSSVAWNWWMRDLVPRSELGRYFGKRLWAASLAAMAATLAAALMADGWAVDRAAAGPFLAGGLLGLAGLAFLARVPHGEAILAGPDEPSLRATPGSDPRLFRTVAAVAATLGIALPFVGVFLLRALGLSLLAATALAALSQVGFLASLRGWGHLCDRHGHRPVLLVALGMLVCALLLLAFLPLHLFAAAVALAAVAHFLSGFAVGGIDLTTANLALKLAPARRAPVFLARVGMAKALAGGLAALAAGAAWQALGAGAVLDLAPGPGRWPLVGFQVLALASAAVGLAALGAASRIEEPGSRAVREVAVAMRREVRQMSSVAGVRAFVHSVSYVVEAVAPRPRPPPGPGAP